MDRKSIIILVVTVLLFLAWGPLLNKIFPPVPAPPATNIVSSVTGTNETILGETNLAGLTNGPLRTAGPTNLFAVTNAPAGKEENITIENPWARYHFSSFGGGIKLVELKEFDTFVGCDAKKLATNPPAS